MHINERLLTVKEKPADGPATVTTDEQRVVYTFHLLSYILT